MTKQEIQAQWFSGANAAAAKLINERYKADGIQVSKWALRSWLKNETNHSPLSAIYLAAYTEVINNRKSAK